MKHLITLFLCIYCCNTIIAQPGTLDSTFGNNGVVITDGIYDACYAMVIQIDGKTILAGSNFRGVVGFKLMRYNTDGSIDQSFGTAGSVFTIFSNESEILAVNIQDDGKIIAAGRVQGTGVDVGIIRYNIDGSIDESFGNGGTGNYINRNI